jgi:hypothetical protein
MVRGREWGAGGWGGSRAGCELGCRMWGKLSKQVLRTSLLGSFSFGHESVK